MSLRDDDDGAEAYELRSYGRRRARKLSPRQSVLMHTLLPRLAINPLAPALSSDRPVWLEIGFGGGEHLLAQARAHPDVLLLGCEPFEEGVVKVLSDVDRAGPDNIRLLADDARILLRHLPERSIARSFILFPDPWPKRRHVKRRLVNAATLDLLARAMQPGGELRVATDIEDYARTMLMAFRAEPRFIWDARAAADWQRRPADWPQTRYEQKAVREGRRSCYLRFVRR
jgi:tRNA (guanine-N7-)-methyltransferase